MTCLSLGCFQSKMDHQNNIDMDNKEMIPEKNLLENVRLAINPKYRDWVLFENGTYIIFDKVDTNLNPKEEAIKLMKQYGPVHSGGPAGDFSVTHLNKTEGWVVSGHGYGMYTYVNPTELESNSPSEVEIGLYGRSKRNQDGLNPKIIHINKK